MKLELNNGHIFTHQALATLNQAAPVQNTWYTILDTTANVRVYAISVNVEDTNEDLNIQITIDGQTITSLSSVSATHSTNYYPYIKINAISRVYDIFWADASTQNDLHGNIICEGKSIKIEVRKTSAAGAGNLTGTVMYGVLEAI